MELSGLGITFGKIQADILKRGLGDPRCDDTKTIAKVRACFQKKAYESIKMNRQPNFVYRIREKITRWKLPGVEAKVGAVIANRLMILQGSTAPRVQAACFSTLWNRWCTPRRFGKRSSPANVCLLGCAGWAEDSIEHYVHCKAVRRVANSFLKLGPTVGMEKFMLSDEALGDQESLVCMAVLICATYNTANRLRCKGRLEHEGAVEALQQGCRNAVMGHRPSMKVVDSRRNPMTT